MAKYLPGLNYDSKLNIDDLTFQSDETEKAILDRTTIVFGSRSLTEPRYGIIDLVNPTDVISSDITRPLMVYANTINPLNINISSGSAVTLNGAIVMNPLLVEDLSLARIAVDDINVVFIENEIVDAPPKRKTRYNVDQYTRRVQNQDVLKVVLLSDYQNSVLFPPQRKSNIVVLAVITVVQNTSSLGLELNIDYANSSYTFNRPWYSPVDIEHRSKVGGGIVTDNNAHGLTYNDLASGNLTLYDQLLSTGCVLAKDNDLYGVVGTPCYEEIEPSRILIDGTGVTSDARFGGAGKSYIELGKFPVQITAFYLSSHKGVDIVWEHVKGTKLVVIPNPDTFTSTAIIEYNRVYTLEPPSQIFSNNLTFGQPEQTKELLITGGIALATLSSQFIDFDGSGPVPRRYTIYANSDGTLLKAPQSIQSPILLDDIGTMITTISSSIFGPAKISIGLAGANASSSMSIVLRISGRSSGQNGILPDDTTDVEDAPLTEDITFSGSTWQTTPYLENPNQYILSTFIYKTLSTIQVVSRTADGPNSKIQLWAELETGTTLGLNKLAKAASVMWNGTGISELLDQRKIVKSIPSPQHRFSAAAGIVGLGGTSPKLVYSEDFANPVYRNSAIGSVSAVAATVRLRILDYSRITAGDSIVLPYLSKTLTAIISGVPNRASGQFLRQTSNQTTRDDIISTLNNSTFASGYTATADNALGDNTILITATASLLSGARGNGTVAITTVQSNTFTMIDSILQTISGLIGGIDAFGECFFPRHMDYIDTELPLTSSSYYDVTSYRYRYQSRPFPIGSVLSVKVIAHDVDAPQTNIQLRTRVAVGTDPTWLPWEVITGSGALFTVTKSSVITKIQLQLFGKASGYSVYEV